MELAIFKNTIPIKAIPEKNLNALILGDFLDWISATLSLNEDAVTKLEYALPAIKEHCWSMGFPEIKKMIEMYADGKLSVKPIPNHFDRIKLGEVVNAYRQQKKVPKKDIQPIQVSDSEKEFLIIQGIINAFENYQFNKEVLPGSMWLYEHFYHLDKFPIHTLQFREKVRERALKRLKRQTNEQRHEFKRVKFDYSEDRISRMCKEIILTDWFDKLIENKIDIKTEI